MSTPRFLALPAGVRADRLATTRGDFAILTADPPRARRKTRAPVLLLPGWTGSKEDFLAILGPVARLGRRVMAIDHRGQYESPGPDDLAAYTLEAYGGDVVAIADALDAGPVHVVGHSFGGLIARAAVLADPTVFASITLLASGPGRLGGVKAAQLRVMAAALPVVGLSTVYVVKRQLDRGDRDRTGGLSGSVSPEIEEFLRRRFCAAVPASLAAMTRHLTDAPDLTDALTATDVPALVVTGADDDRWPLDEQADMAARLGAKYTVIAEAGHSPAVEAPEETTRVFSAFWDEVEKFE